MQYTSEKTLLFYFLESRDYNKSLEDFMIGIGYDLGDYNFKDKETYKKAKELARFNWLQLNGFFDKKGN